MTIQIKSLFENFTGFILKYAGELSGIVTALTTVTRALPIDASDKTRINDILSQLGESVISIREAVARMSEGEAPHITIKESDIEHAVEAVLKRHGVITDATD